MNTPTLQHSAGCALGFYVAGEQITLTATAASGNVFAGWSGVVSSGQQPWQLTMPAAAAVITATFAVPQTCTAIVVNSTLGAVLGLSTILQVQMYGGGGGGGSSRNGVSASLVTTTLTVNPGDLLQIYVGGGGGGEYASGSGGGSGYYGGGGGGAQDGAGGGGSTAVLLNGTLKGFSAGGQGGYGSSGTTGSGGAGGTDTAGGAGGLMGGSTCTSTSVCTVSSAGTMFTGGNGGTYLINTYAGGGGYGGRGSIGGSGGLNGYNSGGGGGFGGGGGGYGTNSIGGGAGGSYGGNGIASQSAGGLGGNYGAGAGTGGSGAGDGGRATLVWSVPIGSSCTLYTCYTLQLVLGANGASVSASLPRSAGCAVGSYAAGDQLLLTATAASSHTFSNWTGAASTSNPLMFVMPAAATQLTAVFV